MTNNPHIKTFKIQHGFWLTQIEYTKDDGSLGYYWLWNRRLAGALISSFSLQPGLPGKYNTRRKATSEAYKWWTRALEEFKTMDERRGR